MEKFKAILLIDFDDTIAYSSYPAIHGFKENADYYINKLFDEKFYITINTCRTGIHQQQVVDFLNSNGVKFHKINENHPALIDFFKEDSRKLSGDIHLDDKNIEILFNPGMNWNSYYSMIHSIVSRKNFKSILSVANLNL